MAELSAWLVRVQWADDLAGAHSPTTEPKHCFSGYVVRDALTAEAARIDYRDETWQRPDGQQVWIRRMRVRPVRLEAVDAAECIRNTVTVLPPTPVAHYARPSWVEVDAGLRSPGRPRKRRTPR